MCAGNVGVLMHSVISLRRKIACCLYESRVFTHIYHIFVCRHCPPSYLKKIIDNFILIPSIKIKCLFSWVIFELLQFSKGPKCYKTFGQNQCIFSAISWSVCLNSSWQKGFPWLSERDRIAVFAVVLQNSPLITNPVLTKYRL